MGRWRTLAQLREDYKASGIELPKRVPVGPGTESCRRKNRYATFDEAERRRMALVRKHKRHPALRDRLNSYPCRWCHGWHVGRIAKQAHG